MKQKRITIFAAILLFANTMMANPVDSARAIQVAQSFMLGQTNSKAEFVEVSKQAGLTNMYIFASADSVGFVIVSADDRVRPILGYSESNPFDASKMPPNLRDWLMGYEMQIQYAKDENVQPTNEVTSEWNTLHEGGKIAPKSTKSVSALISTRWDQAPYYNAQCPYNQYTGEQTLTGCVATAMAQIMKYWNYPTHGRNIHSYNSNFGTLFAAFGWTQYDWTNMPTQLTGASSSAQINAVATLLYHCGVSVNMNYGFAIDGGSSAYPAYVAPSLVYFFRYDEGAELVQKNDYTNNNWISVLKNELDEGRPIFYAGFGEGGHAFICDGYNNSNYFHFNWGWSGAFDGYYTLTDLTPGTGGAGAGSGSYTINQQAVIGIKPSTVPIPNLRMHSSLSLNNNNISFGTSIGGSIQVLNQGNTPFTGYLAVAILNQLDMVMDVQTFSVTGLQNNYYATGNFSFSGGTPFVPGEYYALAMYSTDGNVWDFVPYGTNNEYPFATFDVYSNGQIQANSNFSNTTFVQGQNATVNVDVLNTGSSTFTGKIRLRLSRIDDGSHIQNIEIKNITSGLQPNYHYTNGLTFTGNVTVAPGTYLMDLCYQRTGETSWYWVGAGDNYPNPVFVTVVAPPTLNVSPAALSFEQSGGSRPVEVTSNVVWSASTSASWLTVSPNSGAESTTIIISAAANNTNSSRTATITLSGTNGVSNKTINVTQAGPTQYTITVMSADQNMGSVNGGGTYTSGSAATIGAIANNGYQFVRWHDNNTHNPRTITVTGNATYTAYFEAVQAIDDIEANNNNCVVVNGDCIVVEGAGGKAVWFYDVNGRALAIKQDENSRLTFDVPSSGTYFVKIGNHPARKVVVIR